MRNPQLLANNFSNSPTDRTHKLQCRLLLMFSKPDFQAEEQNINLMSERVLLHCYFHFIAENVVLRKMYFSQSFSALFFFYFRSKSTIKWIYLPFIYKYITCTKCGIISNLKIAFVLHPYFFWSMLPYSIFPSLYTWFKPLDIYFSWSNEWWKERDRSHNSVWYYKGNNVL